VELSQQISVLEAAGLIQPAATPEREYQFRHGLIQDAAYESLLRHDRRRLHRAVGEALERLFPERQAELAPLLGHHFAEAGEEMRALEHYTRAGDAAARRFANAEAVLNYERALSIARRTGAPGEVLRHLYQGHGRGLELSARYGEALAVYEEMEAEARARGDSALELASILARATVRTTPNPMIDLTEGRALLERALELIRMDRNPAAEAKLLWNLMRLEFYRSADQAVVLHYGEQSLALARAHNLREQLAYTLHDLGLPYWSAGRLPEALVNQKEVGALWRELGNSNMLGDALGQTAILHFNAGDFERAAAFAEESAALSREIGNRWVEAHSDSTRGRILLERGRPGEALAVMDEALRLGEELNIPTVLIPCGADRACVLALLGAVEEGIQQARRACEVAAAHLPFGRPWPLAVLALLQLQQGDVAAAARTVAAGEPQKARMGGGLYTPLWIQLAAAEVALAQGDIRGALDGSDKLLGRLEQTHTRPFRSDVLYLRGRALIAAGETEAATQALEAAAAEARALGTKRHLWSVLAALARLAGARGDPAGADDLYRQARRIIEEIAAAAGAPAREQSFRARPEVRAVLEGR
jgi:tetratricopeptide (TPR) repeat protein